jgi:hypothetical protein
MAKKLTRGRPPKDDGAMLRDVASLLLNNPTLGWWTASNRFVNSLSPEAIKRLNVQPDSIVRRLWRKAQVGGEVILADLKAERACREQEDQAVVTTSSPVANLGSHAHLIANAARFLNSPEAKVGLASLKHFAAISPELSRAIANMPKINMDPALLRTLGNAARVFSGITLPRFS